MEKRHFKGIIQSPYDNRDYKYSDLVPCKSTRFKEQLPKQYESPMTPFVYDQGNSEECAACSYNLVRYMQESNTNKGGSGIEEPFSPSFNYANRIPGEYFEGMYLRSVCKKGKDGSIPYSVFPGFYTFDQCREKFLKNQTKWLEMAKPFAINSYYQCTDRTSVKSAIIECGGVIGGVWVYDSFYKPDNEGIIHYDPKTDTENYGGHAIVICGYKEINGKLYWRIQNSWGLKWGQYGRAWIPEDYPWIESPWAVVDMNFETKWKEYKEKYNL